MKSLLMLYLCGVKIVIAVDSYISHKPKVACEEEYIPEDCGYPNIVLEDMITGEDFERCAPAVLPIPVRNYVWGGAGRKKTYERNIESLRRAYIIPRMFRDISRNHLRTVLLGSQIQFPFGVSPIGALKLIHPDGEIAVAKAAASVGAVMTLSSVAQTSIEDVAKAAYSVNKNAVLWMQLYILKNRAEVRHLLRKAENAGFKAAVVTVDSNVAAKTSCDARGVIFETRYPNLFNESLPESKLDPSITTKDLAWLVKSTKLPIVAKGILSGRDAIKAAAAGVSAILVSNHGGRQMDSAPATFDVLPTIVRALENRYPNVEVYMDGGIRNGWDAFKALEKGAKAAFVGRLQVWGLALAGEEGVRKALTILRTEFNETMLTGGYANPGQIYHGKFSIFD